MFGSLYNQFGSNALIKDRKYLGFALSTGSITTYVIVVGNTLVTVVTTLFQAMTVC